MRIGNAGIVALSIWAVGMVPAALLLLQWLGYADGVHRRLGFCNACILLAFLVLSFDMAQRAVSRRMKGRTAAGVAARKTERCDADIPCAECRSSPREVLCADRTRRDFSARLHHADQHPHARAVADDGEGQPREVAQEGGRQGRPRRRASPKSRPTRRRWRSRRSTKACSPRSWCRKAPPTCRSIDVIAVLAGEGEDVKAAASGRGARRGEAASAADSRQNCGKLSLHPDAR